MSCQLLHNQLKHPQVDIVRSSGIVGMGPGELPSHSVGYDSWDGRGYGGEDLLGGNNTLVTEPDIVSYTLTIINETLNVIPVVILKQLPVSFQECNSGLPPQTVALMVTEPAISH